MKTPPPIKRKDPSSVEYYVQVSEEQLGPYDFEKIKVLLEFKNIDENTLIWKEGMKEWDNILNLNEFSDYIIPTNLSSAENKSKEEKVIAEQNAPIEIKTNSVGIDYIKWFNIISIISLIASSLASIGAVQQYFQFQNSKEIDQNYIGPFSVWGGFIAIILSLICVVYLWKKKANFRNGLISLIVGVSVISLLTYTESEYRSFWKPYWENDTIFWNLPHNEQENIREGWRKEEIDSDSLNKLNQFYLHQESNNQIEVKDEISKVNKSTVNSDKLNDELVIIEEKIDDLTRKKIKNDQLIMEKHNHEAATQSGRCSSGFCLWRADSMQCAEDNKKIEVELKFLIIKKKRLLN